MTKVSCISGVQLLKMYMILFRFHEGDILSSVDRADTLVLSRCWKASAFFLSPSPPIIVPKSPVLFRGDVLLSPMPGTVSLSIYSMLHPSPPSNPSSGHIFWREPLVCSADLIKSPTYSMCPFHCWFRCWILDHKLLRKEAVLVISSIKCPESWWSYTNI